VISGNGIFEVNQVKIAGIIGKEGLFLVKIGKNK
jgi:hypothetical protein